MKLYTTDTRALKIINLKNSSGKKIKASLTNVTDISCVKNNFNFKCADLLMLYLTYIHWDQLTKVNNAQCIQNKNTQGKKLILAINVYNIILEYHKMSVQKCINPDPLPTYKINCKQIK